MAIDQDHPLLLQMLEALYRQTGGDPCASISMYDLGKTAGIDREQSQEVGQALIGAGLAVIVSLSGKIGLTAEGIAFLQDRGAALATSAEGVRLGSEAVIGSAVRDAVEAIVAGIKTATGQQRWDFDRLAELMADLRTIEAQLASPRPKTPILRECLRDARTLLNDNGARDAVARISALID